MSLSQCVHWECIEMLVVTQNNSRDLFFPEGDTEAAGSTGLIRWILVMEAPSIFLLSHLHVRLPFSTFFIVIKIAAGCPAIISVSQTASSRKQMWGKYHQLSRKSFSLKSFPEHPIQWFPFKLTACVNKFNCGNHFDNVYLYQMIPLYTLNMFNLSIIPQ